ncbi:hypothetical protein KSP39_PZI007134 [Platanthera zijinensis]|uniref:Uncharacterized protein n=1 Tax=Platanthera zijinensis TaxID=2320716 RepID=A0AAP0BP11_9ASPA
MALGFPWISSKIGVRCALIAVVGVWFLPNLPWIPRNNFPQTTATGRSRYNLRGERMTITAGGQQTAPPKKTVITYDLRLEGRKEMAGQNEKYISSETEKGVEGLDSTLTRWRRRTEVRSYLREQREQRDQNMLLPEATEGSLSIISMGHRGTRVHS